MREYRSPVKRWEIEMQKLGVLLCDDHEGLRGALKCLINSQPDLEVVAEARDGASLLKAAEALSPDIVLLDVSLPDMSGIEAAAALRQRCPSTKILALSAHEDQGYVDRMRAAGAAAYVVKRAAGEELVTAIRAAASAHLVTEEVMEQLQASLPQERWPVDELSAQETSVIALLAKGLSTAQIALELELTPRLVEVCRFAAMRKLQLKTRADVMRYAMKRGLLKLR